MNNVAADVRKFKYRSAEHPLGKFLKRVLAEQVPGSHRYCIPEYRAYSQNRQ